MTLPVDATSIIPNFSLLKSTLFKVKKPFAVMIHCASAKPKYKLPQKQVYVSFIILVDTAGKRAKQKMLSSLPIIRHFDSKVVLIKMDSIRDVFQTQTIGRLTFGK